MVQLLKFSSTTNWFYPLQKQDMITVGQKIKKKRQKNERTRQQDDRS